MNNIDILEEKEKKAINNLNFIVVTDIYDNEVRIDKTKIINEYNESVGIVLNLVSNLIAENKELKEKNRQAKMRIVQLENEISARIEDVNTYYIPKSKIKAKIEEINKEMLNEENSLELFYRKKYCKEVLQSLLGKE